MTGLLKLTLYTCNYLGYQTSRYKQSHVIEVALLFNFEKERRNETENNYNRDCVRRKCNLYVVSRLLSLFWLCRSPIPLFSDHWATPVFIRCPVMNCQKHFFHFDLTESCAKLNREVDKST